LRRYQEQALTQEELSFLLWTTQGVKSVTNRPVTLRTVPSAGARHAFETYLVINQVEGIKPGLYRYISLEHALLPLDMNEKIAEKVAEACLQQNQVTKSAVTFIWVAVTERMYWRYGERGYRYLHLDAGHVCQNLYLAAEAINCGVCAMAAFDDDQLNEVLHLDGQELWVIYCGALGKR
jgi:SagB-type dehydrogenase family enzyme